MNKADLSKNLLTIGNPSSTPKEKQDAWAQHYLDKSFMGWLWATCGDYALGDYHTTEDLVQDGLEQIERAASQYKPRGCPHAWRKRVITNHLINLTKERNGKWNYPLQFRNGNGIEEFLGDDPSFPPKGG